MSNILQRWAFTPQGMEKRQLQDDDGHWVRDTDYVGAIDEMARTHHIRLNRVLDLVAKAEADRDTAIEAVKREQRQFASLATEKREVVEKLNSQLYESNKALSTSAQECQRVQAVLSQAYQDIELLKGDKRKLQEKLAHARTWRPPFESVPPHPGVPAPMMQDTYRVSVADGLMATQIRQNDCVVIVIRRKGFAAPGPFPAAVITEVGND